MKSPFEFYKKQLPMIILLLLIIMGIRSSIIEPFRIPTRSMLPGLITGDFLFANKMRYGFHIPFTEYFGKPVYLSDVKKPERGEVIIFTPPEAGQESLYIKRIVALPGDKVRFEGKNVLINGQALRKIEVTGKEREDILNIKGFDTENRYDKSKLHVYQEYIRTTDEQSTETAHLVMEDDSYDSSNTSQEYTVPPEHYFVLGDNRDDTRDSRVFGVISFRSIRAKALVIWFSWNFELDRIGKPIN